MTMWDGPPGTMSLRLVAAAGLLAVAAGTGFDSGSWHVRSSSSDSAAAAVAAETGTSAVGASMAAWQVHKAVGALVSGQDVCIPINVYCANAKCCSGLVCEPGALRCTDRLG